MDERGNVDGLNIMNTREGVAHPSSESSDSKSGSLGSDTTEVEELRQRVAELTREVAMLRRPRESWKPPADRYADFYQHAPDMMLSVDARTGAVVDCNRTLERKTKYSRDEILGRSVLDMYAPESLGAAREALHEFQSTGTVRNKALVLRTKDDQRIHVLLNVSTVRDEHGRPLYSRSIWHDVSELEALRSELASASKRSDVQSVVRSLYEERARSADPRALLHRGLSLAVEQLGADGALIARIDEGEFVVEYAAGSGGDGWQGRQLVMKDKYVPTANVWFADSRVATRHSSCAALLGAKASIGRTMYRRDRVYGSLEFFSSRTKTWSDEDRELVGLLGPWVEQTIDYASVISERDQATLDLHQNQTRMAHLIAHSPAIQYTCRASGDFGATYMAPNVRPLLGYLPEQFVGDSRFWVERVHPEDRDTVLANLGKLFEAGSHVHEYRFRAADGSYHWMLDQLTLVRDASGTPLEIVGAWIDISDRRKMEQDLQVSNADLQQFAYVASHDLQEPLRMVASYTELLRERYRDRLGADADKYIDYATEGVVRMQTLIDDLLRYSRIHTRELVTTTFDPKQVVDRALRELGPEIEQKKATIECSGLPEVTSDEALVRIVFRSLLENSLRFCEREPCIEIGGRASELDQVTLYVRDNGIGIDPSYKDKVFGVFQRLNSRNKYPGNGIGLAIALRSIERLGGSIRVESSLGGGASFFVTLPGGGKRVESN